MKKLKHMVEAELVAEILATHPELADAIAFSTRMHAGQTRREHVCGRAETPYIEHVLRVCLRLIRLGITDRATLLGALFHDVVEDCSEAFIIERGMLNGGDEEIIRDLMFAFIADEFGADTEAAVRGVTLPPVDQKAWRALSMEDRNRQYAAHVGEAIASNPRSCLIKISDFLDNGGSLHHAPASRQVTRSASKYLPMVDVFIAQVDTKRLGISHATATALTEKLEATATRLETILAVA